MLKFNEIYSRVMVSLFITMFSNLIVVPILMYTGLKESQPTIFDIIWLGSTILIFLTSIILYPKVERHRDKQRVAKDKILNEQYKKAIEGLE